MGLPPSKQRYTPQEYYRLERDAEFKSEYYNGEIFAMAGGTTRHSRIVTNIGGELRQLLKGDPCEALESNQRLKIGVTGLRAYPDVSIYCGPLDYDEEDAWSETGTNPTVLFEVLSPSTESYDRGFKSENYRRIPSLRSYVLVSQDRAHVEVYGRQTDGSWLLREETDITKSVALPGISVNLPLTRLFHHIE